MRFRPSIPMGDELPDYVTTEYVRAAWEAAPAFGLVPENIDILSRSENVVCDLTLPGGDHVVMRFHRPGYNTMAELESEVQWVAALRDAGLPVPTPVPTTDGRYYTSVEAAGETTHVGVVKWVSGRPLGDPIRPGGEATVSHYHRIGELIARMHHHIAWLPSDGFVRRRWDADGLLGEAPLWGRFWEVETLTESQRELFREARIALRSQLAEVPTSDEFFGLIHADLHLGNLMADGDQLTIIDFDDAGFGWFAHDLAVSLHPVLDEPWFSDARAALVAGYRTVHTLPSEQAAWIDEFLTIRCLMIVGWLDARRELPVYEHFNELAAKAEAAVRRYLD